jgi:hypothetical protein
MREPAARLVLLLLLLLCLAVPKNSQARPVRVYFMQWQH